MDLLSTYLCIIGYIGYFLYVPCPGMNLPPWLIRTTP